MVNREHPSADRVIHEVKAGLAALRAFVVAHRIVTIPPGPEPLVRETPPFMRATTFASMDPPGPFEKYAAAAQSLGSPSSAARALAAGAPNIERTDRLVQTIGAQKGMKNDVVDRTVALVDGKIAQNRRAAA